MNDYYYKGFEGETPICISTEDNSCSLKMWNGYFEMLLEYMLNQNMDHHGILKEYILHEGWYDESPWGLINIKEAIIQFQQIDFKFMEQGEQSELSSILPELAKIIIDFLKEALLKKQKISIIYD